MKAVIITSLSYLIFTVNVLHCLNVDNSRNNYQLISQVQRNNLLNTNTGSNQSGNTSNRNNQTERIDNSNNNNTNNVNNQRNNIPNQNAQSQQTQINDNKILYRPFTLSIRSGISILTNPMQIDNAERKIIGAVFDVNFNYAINQERNFKIGVDVLFTHLLSKYANDNYEVNSLGVFLLFQVRYDFLKRIDNKKFIPFITLNLGPLFINQKGAVDNSKEYMTISYGLGGGFDYWFNNRIAFNFNVKIMIANFGVMPGLPVNTRKFCIWIFPLIGINILM